MWSFAVNAVSDPDLQIRVGRGGDGHPDPKIRGGGRSQKKFFSSLWASVWSKNKEGGADSPGPSPRSASVMFILFSNKSICIVHGPNQEPIWAPAVMFPCSKGW